MEKLIIVTGITGIGKTTLASYLYKHYEHSTLISIDKLKESIFDIMGYQNKEEKDNIKEIVYDLFARLLEESMRRRDKVVIVEYPFKIRWQDIFQHLVEKYHYEAITINVKTEDYDFVYERLDKRNNSSERHVIHSAYAYNPKNKSKYKSTNEISYAKWKSDYLNNKYTSINLGTVINFFSDTESYEELLEKIGE